MKWQNEHPAPSEVGNTGGPLNSEPVRHLQNGLLHMLLQEFTLKTFTPKCFFSP